MLHEMTDSATEVKNNTLYAIIKDLRDGINGDGDFQNNLYYTNGMLYNPITRKPLDDSKVIDILSHGQQYTDTRYITETQAESYEQSTPIGNGAYANIAYPVDTVNYSIEEKPYLDGEKEIALVGRKATYYNASEIKEIRELQKEPLSYSTTELHKIYENMQKNVIQSYKNQKNRTLSLNQIVTDLCGSRDDMPGTNEILLTYAMHQALESQKTNNDPSIAPTDQTEKELRDEFKRALGASLLMREISNKDFTQGTPFFGYQMNHSEDQRLADIYTNCPEKLEKDLSSIIKAKQYVKEKVMFMSMERKSKEEIKDMETTAKATGNTLSPSDYYNYKPLNIQRLEERIARTNALTPIIEKKALKDAEIKCTSSLEKEINSIRDRDGMLKIPKSLINKIAKSRKKLGLESNPQKFTQNYKEFHENDIHISSTGEESFIPKTYCYIKGKREGFNTIEERRNTLNKFANGKEGQNLDIMAEVYKDQIALARENAIKAVRSIQGKKARTSRYEKFMSKNSNKEITQSKAKTKAKKRTRSVIRPYCDV